MKHALVVIGTLVPGIVHAQAEPVNDKLGVLYTKDLAIGARLTSSGWAIFGNMGHHINLDRSTFYQLEFTEIKHPKETKQTSENLGVADYPPRPYVFGKQNSFYAVHIGIGRKMLLGEKAEKSGVQVAFSYLGGFSLGILHPYYLDLIFNDDPLQRKVEEHKYDPDNPQVATRFLDFTQIYGSSGFSFGLTEIRPLPGLHGKIGFSFDWASWGDNVKAVEVGLTCDVYYKRVPIMVPDLFESNPNKPYVVGLYIAGMLGKKR
jgi:hypothetical protein